MTIKTLKLKTKDDKKNKKQSSKDQIYKVKSIFPYLMIVSFSASL